MNRRTYLIAFALVSSCVIFNAISALLYWARMPLPYSQVSNFSNIFGHPIPQLLRGILPWQLNVVLFWTFVLLILWRLASFMRRKSFAAPSSVTRIPQVLLLISLWSLALGLLVLSLSMLLSAGSAAPAGMLMIPAVFLLSPTVAWIEMREIFSETRSH